MGRAQTALLETAGQRFFTEDQLPGGHSYQFGSIVDGKLVCPRKSHLDLPFS